MTNPVIQTAASSRPQRTKRAPIHWQYTPAEWPKWKKDQIGGVKKRRTTRQTAAQKTATVKRVTRAIAPKTKAPSRKAAPKAKAPARKAAPSDSKKRKGRDDEVEIPRKNRRIQAAAQEEESDVESEQEQEEEAQEEDVAPAPNGAYGQDALPLPPASSPSQGARSLLVSEEASHQPSVSAAGNASAVEEHVEPDTAGILDDQSQPRHEEPGQENGAAAEQEAQEERPETEKPVGATTAEDGIAQQQDDPAVQDSPDPDRQAFFKKLLDFHRERNINFMPQERVQIDLSPDAEELDEEENVEHGQQEVDLYALHTEVEALQDFKMFTDPRTWSTVAETLGLLSQSESRKEVVIGTTASLMKVYMDWIYPVLFDGERQQFLRDLRGAYGDTFWTQGRYTNGLFPNTSLGLGDQRICPWRLKMIVEEFGGYYSVQEEKGSQTWDNVVGLLGIGNTGANQDGERLRRAYRELILPLLDHSPATLGGQSRRVNLHTAFQLMNEYDNFQQGMIQFNARNRAQFALDFGDIGGKRVGPYDLHMLVKYEADFNITADDGTWMVFAQTFGITENLPAAAARLKSTWWQWIAPFLQHEKRTKFWDVDSELGKYRMDSLDIQYPDVGEADKFRLIDSVSDLGGPLAMTARGDSQYGWRWLARDLGLECDGDEIRKGYALLQAPLSRVSEHGDEEAFRKFVYTREHTKTREDYLEKLAKYHGNLDAEDLKENGMILSGRRVDLFVLSRLVNNKADEEELLSPAMWKRIVKEIRMRRQPGQSEHDMILEAQQAFLCYIIPYRNQKRRQQVEETMDRLDLRTVFNFNHMDGLEVDPYLLHIVEKLYEMLNEEEKGVENKTAPERETAKWEAIAEYLGVRGRRTQKGLDAEIALQTAHQDVILKVRQQMDADDQAEQQARQLAKQRAQEEAEQRARAAAMNRTATKQPVAMPTPREMFITRFVSTYEADEQTVLQEGVNVQGTMICPYALAKLVKDTTDKHNTTLVGPVGDQVWISIAKQLGLKIPDEETQEFVAQRLQYFYIHNVWQHAKFKKCGELRKMLGKDEMLEKNFHEHLRELSEKSATADPCVVLMMVQEFDEKLPDQADGKWVWIASMFDAEGKTNNDGDFAANAFKQAHEELKAAMEMLEQQGNKDSAGSEQPASQQQQASEQSSNTTPAQRQTVASPPREQSKRKRSNEDAEEATAAAPAQKRMRGDGEMGEQGATPPANNTTNKVIPTAAQDQLSRLIEEQNSRASLSRPTGGATVAQAQQMTPATGQSTNGESYLEQLNRVFQARGAAAIPSNTAAGVANTTVAPATQIGSAFAFGPRAQQSTGGWRDSQRNDEDLDDDEPDDDYLVGGRLMGGGRRGGNDSDDD